jgi:hypothetical protein
VVVSPPASGEDCAPVLFASSSADFSLHSAVLTQPANGGKACPALTQTRGCNHVPCNTDCKMSDWTNATACSEPCGAGFLTRRRTVATLGKLCLSLRLAVLVPYALSVAQYQGAKCGDLHLHEDCTAAQCPAACTSALSDWSAWSTCSMPCGGGKQTRTRNLINNQTTVPDGCGGLKETRVRFCCSRAACMRALFLTRAPRSGVQHRPLPR